MRDVALILVPYHAGDETVASSKGPQRLRDAGAESVLRDCGVAVAVEKVERGEPFRDTAVSAARVNRALATHVRAAADAHRLPVVLSGSCNSAMGVLAGLDHAGCGAIWLDAHADFNTPETSPSGNVHGMSAAVLAGEPGLEAVLGEAARAAIRPGNLRLFGIRSIDRGERALLRARGIEVIDMRLIDEFGVGVLMRRVLDAVAAANGLLHVSFDIDFLDPSVAPGVGTTVPGGATIREAHLVMELLHDSGRVASLDVVELNPFLDVRGQSALLLVDLIGSLFGRQIIEHETAPAWTV